MKRRDFLKTSVVAGVALSLNFEGLQAALSSNTVAVEQAPDLVAVMGGEPAVMLDKALEALGGIGKYIKKGQKVVIKPNIGWDRTPELAGNTNPELIKALVKKCFEAGAEKVTVFDHTCDNWQKCYETSGIAHSAEVNFAPANFIITPTEKNSQAGIDWCRDLAAELGFKRISVLTPAEHDHMIGYVSQLCHAIAVSLMCASDNSELANYTGDSFRDLTRIAHINDKMWAELFLWNKDNLISEIDMFESALQDMREKLVRDDREGLEEMFRLSTKRREAFDKK